MAFKLKEGQTVTDEMIRLAQNTEKMYGVPASVTLSQLILESKSTTEKGQWSGLAKRNGWFGEKAGKKWTGDVYVNPKNGYKFKIFNTIDGAFSAYGKNLTWSLYTDKTNKDSVNTPEKYIEAIAETYAPSADGNSGYANTIKNIMSMYNLKKFDGQGTGVWVHHKIDTKSADNINRANGGWTTLPPTIGKVPITNGGAIGVGDDKSKYPTEDQFTGIDEAVGGLAKKVVNGVVMILLIVVALFFFSKAFDVSLPSIG